jgi:hypothetical protein
MKYKIQVNFYIIVLFIEILKMYLKEKILRDYFILYQLQQYQINKKILQIGYIKQVHNVKKILLIVHILKNLIWFLKGTKIYGNIYVDSATKTGITTDTEVLAIPNNVGESAYFEYVVYNSVTNSMRAGTILTVWNASNTSYNDTSTTDLGGSTDGISFIVTSTGGNLKLKAVITDGTWNIKIGTRVIF